MTKELSKVSKNATITMMQRANERLLRPPVGRTRSAL